MIRSSTSTIGARISAGTTEPSPGHRTDARTSGLPARNARLSPWIFGFRGPDLPAPLATAIQAGRISGLLLFRDNLRGSVAGARALRREVLACVPSGRPFLFLADEEGGLISQTSGLECGRGIWPALPTPRALGRIGKARDTYLVARLLGRRLRSLGITVDLAPSLDLDRVRENPVIGSRAFSPNPQTAAELGLAFARGLAAARVAACFKHFPGHGGTRLDSHLTLPTMDPDERREHELPFRRCLKEWNHESLPPWVMSAHVDWGTGRPASLDAGVLSPIRRWSARSLVVTDALDMGAVSLGQNAAGEALAAGNDLLLIGRDWEAGMEAMGRMEREGDAPRRVSLGRASRRMAAPWQTLHIPLSRRLPEVETPAGSRTASEATAAARVGELHRLAVRLSVAPSALPLGDWVWIVPEGFPPYARLREWTPPAGRRRPCRAIEWIPEGAKPGRLLELAQRLRNERRPILLATLFRGVPGPAVEKGYRALLDLPRLALVAHLLDEGWPAPERAGRSTRGLRVAFTSGPSRESLSGLALALNLPDDRWSRSAEGPYFPVDR